MRTSLNIDRLEAVARGLGDRLAETAFVVSPDTQSDLALDTFAGFKVIR